MRRAVLITRWCTWLASSLCSRRLCRANYPSNCPRFGAPARLRMVASHENWPSCPSPSSHAIRLVRLQGVSLGKAWSGTSTSGLKKKKKKKSASSSNQCMYLLSTSTTSTCGAPQPVCSSIDANRTRYRLRLQFSFPTQQIRCGAR
jgi:hypothetical protein